LWNFDPILKIWISRSREKNFEQKCASIFSKVCSKKPGQHWRQSWLTSIRYFEVLLIKLTQTLFLNIILRKILWKNRENAKISKFFLFLFELFCAFKTLTIDLVRLNVKITAENVGTTILLTSLTFKYHLDVSQLSDKGFPGFLFSSLSKKSNPTLIVTLSSQRNRKCEKIITFYVDLRSRDYSRK
jgi:hypothetical protein